MDNAKITFFMIVTDRDIVIANCAVKSYAKIKDIPFKLLVYSNWISFALKQKYFPTWREYKFVEIIENKHQIDENKPANRNLEGPFERGATIWDREIQKISTPYYATVDADFEILDAEFISVMLEELDTNPNLVAISTDYSPVTPEHYDSYSNKMICLQERWHTWFCIYKYESLQCNVSHQYRKEAVLGTVQFNAWDNAGYFQQVLQESYGFKLAVLDSKYQSCFIHYGGFSKNCDIDETNIDLYRRVRILRENSLLGNSAAFTNHRISKLYQIFCQQADLNRNEFVNGWCKSIRGRV